MSTTRSRRTCRAKSAPNNSMQRTALRAAADAERQVSKKDWSDNEAINAFVVFGGCTTDDLGNCSVAMRFVVPKPDGSVYAETPPMEVWHNKPAPPGKSLELSVQYLKVVIEPTDPLGVYRVQTQVKDNISGTDLQLSALFTAVSGTQE